MATKKVTSKERELLAEQMDKDLQEFIDEKLKSYEGKPHEPLDVEKIEKELLDHPAFMTGWDPSKPVTPELEALINLKYEQCEDLDEKATNYKDDGNVNFKSGKYRWASENYTVAIQCKCPDETINAVCYTNRAAAQFRLGNYRSSFQDVVSARKFVPNHLKAILRGVQCAQMMSKFDIALRWIEDGLLIDSHHKELLKLRQTCQISKKEQDKNKRKEETKERKEALKRKILLDAIALRKIRLKGVYGDDHDDEESVGEEWDSLFGKTANSEAASARVFVDDFGTMHWPVIFMYPEYGQTDLISQANETTRLVDLLYQVFGPETPPADWDEEKKYKLENLQIYFEDRDKEALYIIEPEATIQSILSHPKYVVYGGLPTLIVLVRDTAFSKGFLSKYSVN